MVILLEPTYDLWYEECFDLFQNKLCESKAWEVWIYYSKLKYASQIKFSDWLNCYERICLGEITGISHRQQNEFWKTYCKVVPNSVMQTLCMWMPCVWVFVCMNLHLYRYCGFLNFSAPAEETVRWTCILRLHLRKDCQAEVYLAASYLFTFSETLLNTNSFLFFRDFV